MKLVDETVSLPAESKALKDCLVDVIVKLKAKTPLAQLVLTELPALEAAVGNFSTLSEELKSPQETVLAGLMAGQILAALK